MDVKLSGILKAIDKSTDFVKDSVKQGVETIKVNFGRDGEYLFIRKSHNYDVPSYVVLGQWSSTATLNMQLRIEVDVDVEAFETAADHVYAYADRRYNKLKDEKKKMQEDRLKQTFFNFIEEA